jgi:branched-chain amino acid transport system permease protein
MVSYQVVKYFNINHAIYITIGAYYAYTFYVVIKTQLYISILLAIIISMSISCVVWYFLCKNAWQKPGSNPILIIISIGVYIVLQNIISLVYGDNTNSIRKWPVVIGVDILGAIITPIRIAIVLSCTILVTIAGCYLKYSEIGRAMRAVANDPELAKISGINSDKVILISFAIGSALAGAAGILMALDTDMTPTMGMNALMMGVVAMIIGGGKNIIGIVLGALLLSTAQNLGVWYVSSQWQDAIAFIILLVFLLFKPEGFFGNKIRKATV